MKTLGRTQKIVSISLIACGVLSVFWTFVPPPESVVAFIEIVVPAITGVLVSGGAFVKYAERRGGSTNGEA